MSIELVFHDGRLNDLHHNSLHNFIHQCKFMYMSMHIFIYLFVYGNTRTICNMYTYYIIYTQKEREIGVFVTTKSSIHSHPDYIFEGDL